MPITVTEENVQDIKEKSSNPIIIEAFATWCPHCTAMRPIFEQLEKELAKKYVS